MKSYLLFSWNCSFLEMFQKFPPSYGKIHTKTKGTYEREEATMKRRFFSILCCIILTSSMMITGPVYGGEEKTKEGKESPAAEFFDDTYINPEYEQWVKKGRKGSAPDLQDLSYLSETYSEMPSAYGVLPDAYDLREHGLIEPVYDQGGYQNCWAVAANVAAGSPLMGQFPQLSLSPFHTTWFTYRGPEEEEAEYCEDPYEYGGFSASAVATFAAWKGPVTMNSVWTDPYVQGEIPEKTRFNADYHMQDSVYMPTGTFDEGQFFGGNREITKKLIMETGPVSVKFKSDDINFNYETNAWYNNKKDFSDHQVVLAGWDDNYSRENFLEERRPKKDGAWLVRNSWGNSWGDDGYFWLSYEDRTIGISSAIELEEKDNYKKNYQYDTLGWVYSIVPDQKGGETKSGTAANIFKAESDELLEAVSFYTTDGGSEYTISVYAGGKKGSPESGTLLTTQEGAEAFAGYHTIELDEPVKLTKNKYFSIVVTLTNPEFPCAIPVEMRTYYSEDPPEYMGNGGESYILSEGKWKDVAGTVDDYYITNVCIKGFTNPLPESGSTAGSVRTSEKEGPVKDGTEVELISYGSDEIYYSLDGENYVPYEGPVSLSLPEKDDSVTLYAYGVKDGKKGNLTEKTYTKAYAQLTDLGVKPGWISEHFETDTNKPKNIFLDTVEEELSIMAQSSDEIYLEGKKVRSGEWSEPLDVPKGKATVFHITVKGEGKEDTEYEIRAHRDIVSLDYIHETIHFDDKKYRVYDEEERLLKSGDSVTAYADREWDTYLTVECEDGDSTVFIIPSRDMIYEIPLDFKQESTLYSYEKEFRFSENPDMSGSRCCNDKKIPLTPGKDLYFQVDASENNFLSRIFHLEVPDRPEGPELKKEKVTGTSVKLKKTKGVLYSADGKNWTGKSSFDGLKPGRTYTFYGQKKATEEAFSSEISKVKIKTMDQQVIVENNNDKTPGTGDISKIHLWILLLLSVLLLVIILTIMSEHKDK